MARLGILKSILHNFLGTYTSRNSDHEGSWPFGFVVRDFENLRFDLLNAQNISPSTAAMVAVVDLAVTRFAEQLETAGLPRALVKEAALTLTRFPNPKGGVVNGEVCDGFDVKFVARAVLQSGKAAEWEAWEFVAPGGWKGGYRISH